MFGQVFLVFFAGKHISLQEITTYNENALSQECQGSRYSDHFHWRHTLSRDDALRHLPLRPQRDVARVGAKHFYIICFALIWMYFFNIRVNTHQFNYRCSLSMGITVLRDGTDGK